MKNNLSFREYYKRRLPHIQIAGATYFITFRLVNSLPMEVLNQLAEETRNIKKLPESQKESAHHAWFAKFDDYLDKALRGNLHLKNDIQQEKRIKSFKETAHFGRMKVMTISFETMQNWKESSNTFSTIPSKPIL